MTDVPGIQFVDPATVDMHSYRKNIVDCVILTHDRKILMQYRPPDWKKIPDVLVNFGGGVDKGETTMKALVRELNEELGAKVNPDDVIPLGTLTEEWTGHTELVHIHFWHDKDATITGCYEAEDRRYDTIDDVLAEPKLMDYARWTLQHVRKRGLVA
ncbi:MAG TPA: NUDIX domain-containing protein [Alphaproteobacteria bacterium]